MKTLHTHTHRHSVERGHHSHVQCEVHTYMYFPTQCPQHSAHSTVSGAFTCPEGVLLLLFKVLVQAILKHRIEGRGGLRLELKAHNGAHLRVWGGERVKGTGRGVGG